MQTAPAELLKEYVQSQHFTSTADIMGAMKDMFRDVIQTVMEVEMDEELGRQRCERSSAPEGKPRNYRNGYSRKTVKTQLGEVDIKVPRDRNGSYEPKIISKYDRNADGMEDKILALYACGMSQRDIAEQIKELYDVEISPELVTKISEKIMPEVTAWQNRPLENVYPFIFMDAIHFCVVASDSGITNCKVAHIVPFQFQKRSLAQEPAAVARQASIRPDDPVARHDDADRIVPDGAADRLRGHPLEPALLCQPPGEPAVCDRLSIGDLA